MDRIKEKVWPSQLCGKPVSDTFTFVCSEHASVSGIQVELENRELWEKFRAIGNEMILTKSGR